MISRSFLGIAMLAQINLKAQAEPQAFKNNNCTAKQHRIQLPESFRDSHYVRLSKDGRYLLSTLRGSAGGVGILEVVYADEVYSFKSYETPLQDEAYPAEPHWQLISSPYHADGTMKYYALEDLLTKEDKAEPVYSSYFNEFYNSIGGTENRFTMKRWNYLGARDYELENGRIVSESSTYLMCPNLLNLDETTRKQLESTNSEEYIRMAAFAQTAVSRWAVDFYTICHQERGQEACGLEAVQNEFKIFFKQKWDLEFPKVVQSLRAEPGADLEKIDQAVEIINATFSEANLFDRASATRLEKSSESEIEEYSLEQPILSPSGQLIGGIYKEEMRIFSIDQTTKHCTEVKSFGGRTSKVSFGYDQSVSQTLVTFTTAAGSAEAVEDRVVVADFLTGTQTAFEVKGQNSSYPNLTSDGRLFYFDDNELVIVDLHQSIESQFSEACLSQNFLQDLYSDLQKR